MTSFLQSPLQNDGESLPALVDSAAAAAKTVLASLESRPAAIEAPALSPLPLPDEGMGAQAALTAFTQRYDSFMSGSAGPRYLGFVTGGTTPAALAGDWLATAYDQNVSTRVDSIASAVQDEASAMLRDLLALPPDFRGTFVTGATMANVHALALARQWAGRNSGVDIAQAGISKAPPIAVLGGAPHSSIAKALGILGIGRDAFVAVGTLPGREAVDVEALERALEAHRDRSPIVVAGAGIVNTGDFDDLQRIAELRKRFGFWLHVDAAFGGVAAASSSYRHLLAGWEHADSITVDAHKWLNVPYDAAIAFNRHRDLQLATFRNSAPYLGELTEPVDLVHLAPENSARFRGLPVWMTLVAYGRSGYSEIVERTCALAQMFAARLAQTGAFTLLAPVPLNIVCFTLSSSPDSKRVDEFLRRLRSDGRVFMTPTTYRGIPGIRAAFSNWRTTQDDISTIADALMDCVTEPLS